MTTSKQTLCGAPKTNSLTCFIFYFDETPNFNSNINYFPYKSLFITHIDI